ncbi:MAG: MBL fold metallo-hydrolase [Ruminococcus sp.]|nr:MBL fold metallo-hydrolase [Ruminococcus sp.]
MIDVKVFKVGVLATNSYLITDSETGKAAVIDPGFADKRLTAALEELEDGALEYILLTHGHFDHIGAVSEYAARFGAKVVISALDAPFLSDNSLNLSGRLFRGIEPMQADVTLNDNDTVSLGSTTLRFILTPGHTCGSGCYVSEEDRIIFSGDTLFYRSVGRTDFATSDPEAMLSSLHKLMSLQGDYRVLPGHDIETSISEERMYNPYL